MSINTLKTLVLLRDALNDAKKVKKVKEKRQNTEKRQ